MKSKPPAEPKPKRAPNPDDYDGILSKDETRKRIKRKKKAGPDAKPKNKGGRPKGSFSLRTTLRKLLDRCRGNRPLHEIVVQKLIDEALLGDKNFNMNGIKIIMEHLEGKPTQTLVADVSNRDGYADKTDEELMRIARMAPLGTEKQDDEDDKS